MDFPVFLNNVSHYFPGIIRYILPLSGGMVQKPETTEDADALLGAASLPFPSITPEMFGVSVDGAYELSCVQMDFNFTDVAGPERNQDVSRRGKKMTN